MVLIEFIDNGAGIAPENIELVFDEYFTTKDPGHGSGLGLAVCRSLIRETGGDIKIASRVLEGTTVSVSLPIPGIGESQRNAT